MNARKAKGWTQAHLAEVAGVDPRTVQRAERGTASLDTLQALAQALDADVADFVQPPEPTGATEESATPPPSANKSVSARALLRATTGKGLADIVGGAFAYQFDHADLTGEAVEIVGGFLQSLQDWGDIWSDLGPLDRARAAASMGEELGHVEALGLWVFAARERRRMRFGDGSTDVWPVATVVVLPQEDPSIVKLDLTGAAADLDASKKER